MGKLGGVTLRVAISYPVMRLTVFYAHGYNGLRSEAPDAAASREPHAGSFACRTIHRLLEMRNA